MNEIIKRLEMDIKGYEREINLYKMFLAEAKEEIIANAKRDFFNEVQHKARRAEFCEKQISKYVELKVKAEQLLKMTKEG